MKTLFKVYSMVVLLGSMSCFGSDHPILLHAVYHQHDIRAGMSSPYVYTTTTYNLVNGEAKEYADGCGIIQAVVCNVGYVRWGSTDREKRLDIDKSYCLLFELPEPKELHPAVRWKLYRDRLKQQGFVGFNYATLQAAQQAVPDYLAEKRAEQQRLNATSSQSQCLDATSLPAVVGDAVPEMSQFKKTKRCVIS